MKKEKQTILITGASSGLGRETAIRLAKEGNKVFAGIRRKADKIELENLNNNIKGVYIDITSQSSIDKAFWFIIKNTDKLDVMINNAGIAAAAPVEYLDIKRLKEQFEINTFGTVAAAQKFMPLLNNGKIINISSMAAAGIFPFISPYAASKRATDILFNALALENKNNIKVISVKPASIKTPIWNKSVLKAKEAFEQLNEAAQAKYKKEMLYLEKNALKNNETALETYMVVDEIIKIINAKNPKPSLNIGSKAIFTDIAARFLPLCLINKIIKSRLKKV